LVLLLSVNSYAWFIYSTKVSNGVTARVRAWDVLFQVGEEEITQDINFNLDEIYPGMTNYTNSITVTNRGDTTASFTYKINSANVLGTTYTESELTPSSYIQNALATNYPFTITIGVNNSSLSPGSQASFNISVVWPYESGNDANDTYWGNLAYTYKQNHPDLPSISIDITIAAYQST
jgi:hypothetical protein